MRFPKTIEKNDHVGIVAPSFGCTIAPYDTRLKNAAAAIQKRGYNVDIAPNVYKTDGLGICTNPKDAGKEFTDWYVSGETSALISAGGGELACEILPYVDFDAIRSAQPKWFVGYSDNTNILFPLATLCDTAGIYGPNIGEFGKFWERPEKNTFELLEKGEGECSGYSRFEGMTSGYFNAGPNPNYRYHCTRKKVLSSFVPQDGKLIPAEPELEITASGMLLGGCLDCLENLAGTVFDGTKRITSAGKPVLWFFEACDLNPMQIRRAVWHLANAGWFDTAVGFIVGRPLAALGQSLMGVDAFNAVTDILAPYGKPVIMDADIGHIHPTMPLMLGSQATVRARGNQIRIDMRRKSD